MPNCDPFAQSKPAETARGSVIPIRRVCTGDRGRLVLTGCAGATVQRLMAMGLVPGTTVSVLRVAPLGDPIILETGAFQVSLRRHEAEGLAIER